VLLGFAGLFALGFVLWLGIDGFLPTGLWGIAAGIGLFLGIFLAVIVIYLLFFLFLFLVFEKTDPRKMFKHALLNWYTHMYYNDFLRVRVRVSGRENLPKNRRFVVVSNHIEASDPMYIKQVYRRFPLAFVSKVALFQKWPVKNILQSVGCVPISPKVDQSALESIEKSIRLVESGLPMGIFPEGRRTYCNEMIAFRPGSFKLPMKAKADISPVAVYGMHDIYRKGRIRPVRVYLHVLPLIPYEEYKDLDTVTLAQKVHDLVEAQMQKFASETKK
jgi:1-acyl-sn-glycerol-3-phosphate acyltransferase